MLVVAVVVVTTRLVVLVVGWLLVRVQAIVARMVLERIALALVVRKPMATHLVQEEMGQEVIRAAAAVAIGAVGARVSRHN